MIAGEMVAESSAKGLLVNIAPPQRWPVVALARGGDAADLIWNTLLAAAVIRIYGY
jgi:hypothetical protein